MMDLLFDAAQRLTAFAAADGWVLPQGQTPAISPGDGAQMAYTAVEADPGFFGQTWIMLVIWGAVFVGMYFLMFRPQRKREKAMKEMQAAIKSGDNVVTSGGLFGRVIDVGTDCFVVELGISGRSVRIPVLKNDVLGIREPIMTPPPKEVE